MDSPIGIYVKRNPNARGQPNPPPQYAIHEGPCGGRVRLQRSPDDLEAEDIVCQKCHATLEGYP